MIECCITIQAAVSYKQEFKKKGTFLCNTCTVMSIVEITIVEIASAFESCTRTMTAAVFVLYSIA